MNANDTVRHVLLEDGALRDGLQAESRRFSLEEKLTLFKLLQQAGVPQIQVGSFVHPGVIPQMADTDALIQAIGEQHHTVVSALVLNERGLARALACSVPHVNLSVSVSDTHSRKNTQRPAKAALDRMTALIDQALKAGLGVRGGLQCVFGCVYEGPIDHDGVIRAAEQMADAGAEEINLADTTGMATPGAVEQLVGRMGKELPHLKLSLHLHDTRGLGLANIWAGYQAGVRAFDVCAGGLGGCPFVKGAAGNVPTEDAIHLFDRSGISTGIDLQKICAAVAFLESVLKRQLPGRMKRVLDSRQDCDMVPSGPTAHT